nr:hypothetical protein [Tanacetum cinerariifolium]
MTKGIKEELEKLENLEIKDVSLTYDTSLEVFNNEFSRLSGMEDDLFTYDVEVTNIPCNSNIDDDSKHDDDDDMGYDPSDVALIEWLSLKIFNYKTMDHYTMKSLWIYWIRGDDEVELTDEESSDSDDDDEVAKDLDLLTKDIVRFKTYEDYKDDWIYEWNKNVPWIDEEDDDDSQYEQRKRWNVYTNYDDAYEINHEVDERDELREVHELPGCLKKKYKMIKYSFNNDEEYVAVKDDEYDDLTITREEACRAYQEIFWMMDEACMVTTE